MFKQQDGKFILWVTVAWFRQWSMLASDYDHCHLNHNVRKRPSDRCAQWRFRSACANAQSDLNLYWAHFGLPRVQRFFMQTTKTLVQLRRFAGWFESSMGAHVWRYIFSRKGSFILYVAGASYVSVWLLLPWSPEKTLVRAACYYTRIINMIVQLKINLKSDTKI